MRPAAYARTRNALDGAVTGLSPYITHGFVTLTDVLAGVAARQPLDIPHKIVFEPGWRASHCLLYTLDPAAARRSVKPGGPALH